MRKFLIKIRYEDKSNCPPVSGTGRILPVLSSARSDSSVLVAYNTLPALAIITLHILHTEP